jgi:hypothetical protein
VTAAPIYAEVDGITSSERDRLASLDVSSTTNSVADRRPDAFGDPLT